MLSEDSKPHIQLSWSEMGTFYCVTYLYRYAFDKQRIVIRYTLRFTQSWEPQPIFACWVIKISQVQVN